MANVTDLTGYTWIGNDSLDSLGGSEEDVYLLIQYTCNNTNYTSLQFIHTFDDEIDYELHYGDTEVYSWYGFPSLGWQNADYKTITFTGGDAIKDTRLIEWLEENGTLTKEETKKLKLGAENVKMCLGNIEVDKIYLGAELLYEK